MSANNNRSAAVSLNQLVASIPVRRKLVDQNDRDKFEWSQWQSATKAINNVESPAKEKHVRNLILGTFRLEGTRLFWSMVTRIHVESHPIVSWKFCYAIHRLLRDGHKNAIHDCILLASYFEQLRKYWSGLQQNYGLLTYRYCQLITSKLKFHERNPTFAGNLTIAEHNDIRRLFNNNFDSYFRLCIELFDYMEELLSLVQVIFTALDQSRSNSMTSAGQCRLSPLIVCIQDSSLLYDYIVKVLFKLHEGLPGDTLQGHRQRLIDQFQRLKRFYGQSSTLQYFKNLIKVPILPENPPNFNIKEDLKNYQTPVAIVHAQPPESSQVTDGILIDTSDNTTLKSRSSGNDDLSANETVYNRSKEISDLEQRLMQCDAMLRQSRSETDDLHRTIAAKDTELITERNHRLQIEEQLRQQLDNQQRFEEMHALEHKTNTDEKFNKLLDNYNKLREEHVVVLRQEGEIKKQLTELNQEYTQFKDGHKKKEDEINQNYEKLSIEIIQLRQTNDELQDRIQALTNERNDYKSITITTNERIKEIQHAKQSAEERYKELENDKLRLDSDKYNFERKLNETEVARRDLFDKSREHEESLIDLIHEREVFEQKIVDLEETIREWAQKFIDATDKQKLIETNHIQLISNLKRQYKFSILTYCINQMHNGIDQTKNVELVNFKSGPEYLLSKLHMAVTSTKTIQELWKKQTESNETATPPFLNECITLANCMVDILVHGKATSNLIQDNDQGVILSNNCRDVTLYCIDFYSNYQTSLTSNNFDQQSNELIHRLNLLIEKTKTLFAKNAANNTRA